MIRKGSTTSIVIATVAGLSVLGVAGYRMMGDCGSCAITGNETAAVQTVAAEGDSCCPLKTEGAPQPVLVATEADTCASACSDVKAASCDSATACETSCSDKAEVEMVATEAASECGSACAGDACGVDAEACCGKCDKGQELAKAPQ